MARYRLCSNKDCELYCKLYDLSEYISCPSCARDHSVSKSKGNIMVGLKAAEKGPLATYQPTGDFYMDMLFQNAQDTFL